MPCDLTRSIHTNVCGCDDIRGLDLGQDISSSVRNTVTDSVGKPTYPTSRQLRKKGMKRATILTHVWIDLVQQRLHVRRVAAVHCVEKPLAVTCYFTQVFIGIARVVFGLNCIM